MHNEDIIPARARNIDRNPRKEQESEDRRTESFRFAAVLSLRSRCSQFVTQRPVLHSFRLDASSSPAHTRALPPSRDSLFFSFTTTPRPTSSPARYSLHSLDAGHALKVGLGIVWCFGNWFLFWYLGVLFFFANCPFLESALRFSESGHH